MLLIPQRRIRLVIIAALIPLAVLMTWSAPEPLYGQCYDYPDSHARFLEGIPTCGGWGDWCIECVAGGASCIHASGFTECIQHDVP